MNKQTIFKRRNQQKTFQNGKTAILKDVASINQRFTQKKE